MKPVSRCLLCRPSNDTGDVVEYQVRVESVVDMTRQAARNATEDVRRRLAAWRLPEALGVPSLTLALRSAVSWLVSSRSALTVTLLLGSQLCRETMSYKPHTGPCSTLSHGCQRAFKANFKLIVSGG